MKLLYSLLFLLPLQSFSQSDTSNSVVICDRDYFMQQDVQIRSSRDTTVYYYIDGVKVYANPDTAMMRMEVTSILCGLPSANTQMELPAADPPLEPPVQAVEQVEIITGGVPGTYGDVSGPVRIVDSAEVEPYIIDDVEIACKCDYSEHQEILAASSVVRDTIDDLTTQSNDLCVNRIPAEEIGYEQIDSCIIADPYPIQFHSGRSSSGVVLGEDITQYRIRGCCGGVVRYSMEQKEKSLFSPYVLTGRSANME